MQVTTRGVGAVGRAVKGRGDNGAMCDGMSGRACVRERYRTAVEQIERH